MKKLIQLSTSECPPCQVWKMDIERRLDTNKYKFEYIELYEGPSKDSGDFDIKQYWENVYANIAKYREKLGINFRSFPTFVLDGKIITKQQLKEILHGSLQTNAPTINYTK